MEQGTRHQGHGENPKFRGRVILDSIDDHHEEVYNGGRNNYI